MGLKENLTVLREALGISQEELGNKIGLSRFSVSNYESGKRNVTDRVVQDICREFNVNEEWLRFGTGDMFIEFPQEDEFFRAAAELNKEGDTLIEAGVIEYWKTDKEGRALLKDYLLRVVERIKKEEQD